jgi:glycosyltransferase involved in cell wall biosynthesis
VSGILFHEWLARAGGAENVFETLGRMFPDAEQWCLWNDSGDRFRDVEQTVLARTPLRRSKPLAVPVIPAVLRHLPERDADWVLCSSHCFAHHARFAGPAGEAPKLVYAHTPARYVWVPEVDERGRSFPARAVSRVLKPLDRRRAAEATSIVANSRFVADRIASTWDREARVIYPPVDMTAFAEPPVLTEHEAQILDRLPDDFLLGVSRFVPYKRFDLVVRAGIATDTPVVLAGRGATDAELKTLAAAHPGRVHAVRNPTSALLSALYRRARALVFAPVEDFGLVPVEAMASGTPVVVNAVGGAAESVVDGLTGAHVHDWSPGPLREAVERASRARPQDCIARASAFDTPIFEQQIRAWLAEYVPALRKLPQAERESLPARA